MFLEGSEEDVESEPNSFQIARAMKKRTFRFKFRIDGIKDTKDAKQVKEQREVRNLIRDVLKSQGVVFKKFQPN